MNATDLQTYAALQKPSHVFGNYAEKEKEKEEGSKKEDPTGSTSSSGTTHTTKNETPTPSTPPAKEEPKHTASGGTPTPSASSVASQLVKDTTTVNNLKSVSVSAMNTTLSG
ncbi:hypothetical protein RGC56_07845, partial [Helicobacter pylori]|nr:hypothetical protein [Helicobacter pylori]